MRILAAMLQVEVNSVQNASSVLVSSGFGEFETGLLITHSLKLSGFCGFNLMRILLKFAVSLNFKRVGKVTFFRRFLVVTR